MTLQSHKGLPKGATIRVRLYRPDDHDAVCRIFSAGMMGLVLPGVEEITRGDKRLQAFAVAVPAVAMVLARRCSLLTKLGVGLLSTAAVPAAIYVLVRSLFAKYVKKSLHDDLANIEGFYSTHGAGAGSAFWVAELVEPVAGVAESGALGSATVPAYKRTSSTGLLSASLQSAVTASSAAAAPQALQAPALTAAASSSATPVAHEATAVPAQTSAQAPAGQDGEEGSSKATSAVAAASGQREPAAAPAVPTSVAATAQHEPEARSGAAPDASGAAASTASTEAEDPEAEARRVVAGLVASAVRRLEAAATMAAPSGSAPPASPGPKANGASAAAAGASGLASPRAGSSAVKKPPAAAAPAPAAPPVQAASPAAAAPNPAPVPVSVPAHPAMAIVGSPSPAAAAKPVTPVTSLAAAASLPRTPSSAAFNGAVALAPATRTRVVGHVALERKTWQVAELRRMSVAPECRGAGVGRALLEALTAHARNVGFRELVLHTSSLQLPARRLYERAGWTLTKRVPESGVDIFTYTYDLTKKR